MFGLLIPGVVAAETWRGKIQCDALPGFTSKRLYGDFVMTLDGARLSYSRPVLNPDATSASGIAEFGAGTLADGEVRLQGRASGTGYSYTASYGGRIEGDRLRLGGEQLWHARQFAQPYHRACGIELQRAG